MAGSSAGKIREYFDPELTGAMAAAFDTAWDRLENSKSALARGDCAPRTRYVLARVIVELAGSGERDPDRLCEKALAHLAAAHPVPYHVGLEPGSQGDHVFGWRIRGLTG